MLKKTVLAALSLLICLPAYAETAQEKEDKKKETIKTEIVNFLAGLSIGYTHGLLNNKGTDEAVTFIGACILNGQIDASRSSLWGQALGQSLAEATKECALPFNAMWLVALLAGSQCTGSIKKEVTIYA